MPKRLGTRFADYNDEYRIDRFEVIEYWVVDRETLEENEIDIPKDLDDLMNYR